MTTIQTINNGETLLSVRAKMNDNFSALNAGKQEALGFTPDDVANKSTSVITDGSSDTKYPSVKAVKDYTDSLVAGLLDDRGSYDASVNTFPASGGSGTAGAVKKGDIWYISVAGTLGGVSVTIGDSVRALVDTPGQTAGNWSVLETNIGYVPENIANKDASGGYAGLTLLKINFRNVANTFTSFFTNSNTAARTYTFQNRDGTIADDTDLALKAPLRPVTSKITLVDADEVTGNDSAASFGQIKTTWTNVKAFLKTYFDTLYMALVAPGASGNVLTSNGTSWVSSAPTGGSGSQCEPLQDYMGPAIIGVLGTYVFDSSKTGSKYTITVDTIPVGSNLIVELRKNSYTSGNVLSSTLQIATSDTLTNGKKTVSITDSDAYVAGDYVVAYLTSVGSTTPALNPVFNFTIA